jgi:hypothetical protein
MSATPSAERVAADDEAPRASCLASFALASASSVVAFSASSWLFVFSTRSSRFVMARHPLWLIGIDNYLAKTR